MPKIPDSVVVKCTIHDITLEVPKHFFDNSGISASVLVGRKGRSATSRRSKYFTLADPKLVPSSTRHMTELPSLENSTRRQSSAVVHPESASRRQSSAAPLGEGGMEGSMTQQTGEMAVMHFGSINDVEYDVEMHPLNKFDGNWVFDQKVSHPLTVFVKAFTKIRPGVKQNAVRSEVDSNMNEMLQMDHEESEEDRFSGDNEGAEDENDENHLSLSGINLSPDQLAILTGDRDENEMLTEDLRLRRECKKRYLYFPKEIDLSQVVNTHNKTMQFSERVESKSASLLGSVLTFTITVQVPEDVLNKYESKVQEKEAEKERKRREKEEKVVEKERKKAEKEESKKLKKEEKKTGKKPEQYGPDVTRDENVPHEAPADAPAGQQQPGGEGAVAPGEDAKKKKGGFGPLNLVKGIFSKEPKAKTGTPFEIRFPNTTFPFLMVLDQFELKKLVMPPELYRAVHIRLGCDSLSIDDFPRLLLDASNPDFTKQVTVTGYDGNEKTVYQMDFGSTRVFFADKHIRNVTGFDTIRALQEKERVFREQHAPGDENELSIRSNERQGSDLFMEQILNVGEKFVPVAFAPMKYTTHEAQAAPTKYTRVTAQLIVPSTVPKSMLLPTDLEQKKAFLKKCKAEQKEKERAEKEREKAERKAAKGGQQQLSKENSTVVDPNAPPPPLSSVEEEPHNPSVSASRKASVLEKKTDSGEGEGEGEAFQSSGAGSTSASPAGETKAAEEADPEKNEKGVPSTTMRIVPNSTRSFQLGSHLLNEEFIPKDGFRYHISFRTGEELSFRARRVFLPSLCPTGVTGATDTQLLDFKRTSESK